MIEPEAAAWGPTPALTPSRPRIAFLKAVEMRQDIKQAIRRCDLFAGADDGSVGALARASRLVRTAAGQTLFMAGDEPDGLCILQSGLVRIWIATKTGAN